MKIGTMATPFAFCSEISIKSSMKQKALMRGILWMMIGAGSSTFFSHTVFSHTHGGFVQQSFVPIASLHRFLPQTEDNIATVLALLLAAIASCVVFFHQKNRVYTPALLPSHDFVHYIYAIVFFTPQKEKMRRWGWDDIF